MPSGNERKMLDPGQSCPGHGGQRSAGPQTEQLEINNEGLVAGREQQAFETLSGVQLASPNFFW